MRIFLITLMALFICSSAYAGVISVDSFISPDDVTIPHLEDFRSTVVDAINSPDGGLIQAGTITTASLSNNANPEKRWYDSFNEFVITGLLPPTTTSTLTSTTTAGRALIENDTDVEMKYVEKDATAHTYTLSKWTFVDLSSAGVYTYQETVIGASDPSVTANSIRLARVSTDTTQIFNVRDDRVTSISLGSNEDQYKVGYKISVTTPDSIVITPGFLRHGTTAVAKTSSTTLTLGTAADWAGGISQRGTSTDALVVIDTSGNIKLSTTSPTWNDTSENTSGILRYSEISSTTYRYLSWFRMNATGSGNIDYFGYSNLRDSAPNTVGLFSEVQASTASTALVDDPEAELIFYSSGEPVTIIYSAGLSNSSTGATRSGIQIDEVDEAETLREEQGSTGTTNNFSSVSVWHGVLSQGFHNIQGRFSVSGNTGYVNKRSLVVVEN